MNTTSHKSKSVLFWLLAWALMAAMPKAAWAGSVIVSNLTVIPLKLSDASGFDLGTVGPARSVSIVLDEGEHSLKASRLGGAPYADVKLKVGATGGPTWQILPTEGILEVRNLTTETLTILVDGQALLEVGPSDVGHIDGMRPGRRALTAVYKGEVKAVAAAELSANGIYVWRLTQDGLAEAHTGMVRVSNFAGEYVDIYANGNKRIGIYPGDSAAMVGLPADLVTLTAKNAGGEVISEEKLNLKANQARRWVVTGADGGRAVISVVNQTASPLRVCVDGSYCLRIEPKQSTQYDGVRPGRHTFQAYNLKEDRLLKAVELELKVGSPYRWTVEEPR